MKSYEQFCGLARALDIVGDRWTLLLVRDLLAGDASFGELQGGLPGIATNILTERLRHLEHHQVIWRRRDGRRSVYGLTERGHALTETVHALIRWGTPEMTRGVDGDLVRVEWLAVAIGALVEPTETGGRVLFRVEDRLVLVDLATGEVTMPTTPDPAAVEIETSVDGVLALVSARTTVAAFVLSGAARCRRIREADRLLRAVSAARAEQARG